MTSTHTPNRFSLKYLAGCFCICLYIMDIQYHVFFFTRYFVLEHAFQVYSFPVALVIISLGYYLLMRNIMLYALACRTSPGEVHLLKTSRVNYERKRQNDMQRYSNSGIFTTSDVSTLKSLTSDLSSIDQRVKEYITHYQEKG